MIPTPPPDTLTTLRRLEAAAREFMRYHAMDCGAHYCRYCQAKSPDWEHHEHCSYVLSQKAHSELSDVLALLSSLPPSPETRTCGAIGYPEAGRQVCVKYAGHKGGRDDYHRSVSGVEWLGYHHAPKEPQP